MNIIFFLDLFLFTNFYFWSTTKESPMSFGIFSMSAREIKFLKKFGVEVLILCLEVF